MQNLLNFGGGFIKLNAALNVADQADELVRTALAKL